MLKIFHDDYCGKNGNHHFYMVLVDMLETLMKHNKVLRLMVKFNLFIKMRQANPCEQLVKAILKHSMCPKLLNHEFEQDEPRKVFVTVMPYQVNCCGQVAYFSCVKDVESPETIAYELTIRLMIELICRTVQKLKELVD